MATLEDKILGEKLQNYCSSSSGEDSDPESDSETSKNAVLKTTLDLPEANKWEGTSTNTGPKGVIKDWQRYKQLENEKRAETDRAKIAHMKKLTLSVQTALDEEKAALEEAAFEELFNDDFLLNYQKQRINEMMLQTKHNKKFGKLKILESSDEFLDAIDSEQKTVTVIVHIYEENVQACQTMNMCLKELAVIYDNVKFCSIIGSRAGMSNRFKTAGVPALLIYKAGQLVGNFVRLTDDLGIAFEVEDVQSFLVEHGMLEDKSCTPFLIKNHESDSDTD